jgi:hypothetical protein
MESAEAIEDRKDEVKVWSGVERTNTCSENGLGTRLVHLQASQQQLDLEHVGPT